MDVVVDYPLYGDPIIVGRRVGKPKEVCPYCKKEKTLLYDDTTDNYVVIKNKNYILEIMTKNMYRQK